MSCVFCRFLWKWSHEMVRCFSDLLAPSMSLLMHCEVSMVIEAFLTKFAPKFKQALVFLFMTIQKFFGIAGFSTVTTVEFSSIMAVHMLLVSSCAG